MIITRCVCVITAVAIFRSQHGYMYLSNLSACGSMKCTPILLFKASFCLVALADSKDTVDDLTHLLSEYGLHNRVDCCIGHYQYKANS